MFRMTMFDPVEAKAMADIDQYHEIENNQDSYNNYIKSFVKYKVNLIRKGRSITENVLMKNKISIVKKKFIHLIKIKVKTSNRTTIEEFIESIGVLWDTYFDELLNKMFKTTQASFKKIDSFAQSADEALSRMKASKDIAFKSFNLLNFNQHAGNVLEFKSK